MLLNTVHNYATVHFQLMPFVDISCDHCIAGQGVSEDERLLRFIAMYEVSEPSYCSFLYHSTIIKILFVCVCFSYYIRTSSKLEGGVGSSPAQQALVYAFLGDHDKVYCLVVTFASELPTYYIVSCNTELQAISRLQDVVKKGRRNADLFTVLGKVQLRARMFNDAATSFTSAIELIVSTHYHTDHC